MPSFTLLPATRRISTVMPSVGKMTLSLGPRERYSRAVPRTSARLGFRCTRSARPRWLPEDFVTPLPD